MTLLGMLRGDWIVSAAVGWIIGQIIFMIGFSLVKRMYGHVVKRTPEKDKAKKHSDERKHTENRVPFHVSGDQHRKEDSV